MTDADLRAQLDSHAHAAVRQGLRPLVFVRTTWNRADMLPEWRANEADVRSALRGWYIIDVEFDEDCMESKCHGSLFGQVMCGTWGPSFHALDAEGHPGRPIYGGSKEGMASKDGVLRVLSGVREVLDAIDRGEDVPDCAGGPKPVPR